jgi:signal transduction histidine kinase
MKSLAEVVLELPGLCPAAASLAALARPAPTTWPTLRDDPAALLLLVRHLPSQESITDLKALGDDNLLAAALDHLERPSAPFIDPRHPGVDAIRQIAIRQANLAAALAPRLGVDPAVAWTAAILTPLGWYAIAAGAPERVLGDLGRTLKEGSDWQSHVWGLDHTTLTRRLCRAWRLPAWLSAILGNLGLDVALASRLGADTKLFRVVQLAVAGVQRFGGLALTIGTPFAELLHDLDLTEEPFDLMVSAAVGVRGIPLESPRDERYLADLLRLAIENRARADRTWIDRLDVDLDRLHCTLEYQHADEQARLKQQKLAALAEFAAGAGHEINNPLAVISGQAQYLMKQLEVADELLVEDPSPTLYLDHLRTKFAKSLQAIVGQTQRIHQVLTDLMQFSRPPAPRPALVPVAKLFADITAGLRTLADERKVRIACPEAPPTLAIRVDPVQIRVAIQNLLRNAIEAAPADGCASLRVERANDGTFAVIVEDNGPGPQGSIREHLFDPFFSGRSAGRGRGLGLPAAWRLARQHGGDVRFDASVEGVTRFVLSLPADLIDTCPTNGQSTNGRHAAANGAVHPRRD